MISGGFSPLQLSLNYLGFLPMPVLLVGLYAVQRPGITRVGLLGALLYGGTFVYFAHTTLYALQERISVTRPSWCGWVDSTRSTGWS